MNKIGKPTLAIAALFLAVAAVVVLAVLHRPATTSAGTVALRLFWVHQAQFAGFYAAEATGAYKRRGMEVEIRGGGPGVNPVTLVASGAEQLGTCSATDVIRARAQGIPIRALAIVVKENPATFFARADANIRDVKSFKGKRVGIKLGTESEYDLKAMLAHEHVNESDVQTVPIRFDMTPFFQRQVDVWCGYRIDEPQIARERGVEVTEILPGDYGVVAEGDVLFTSESYYSAHPDLCRNFVDASFEGWTYAKSDPRRAIDFVLKYNPNADRQHEAAMLKGMTDLVFGKGRTSFRDQSEAEWAAMLEFMRRYEKVPPDVMASDCHWDLK